ncbi:hypothetical protein Cgig2_030528 [Carnegiea gigantea]|uniref:Endonuclease/exonuclease/phosphatase domain-containing protein n=1 Tax=Carnegiea gigantea TaxID=171969 RepID=A0A9Q1GIE3_9CARY|nr:hypothetical protein Cgig2_030528 [Carnegiea gigantea]
MFSHTRDDCRKKPQSRTEWRLEPQELAPPHLHTDKESFITARKRTTTTATGSKDLSTAATTAPPPVQNSFKMLVANEGNEVMHPTIEGGAPMDRICSWNIRGLNWPNKQEDVKIFLHEKHIGFIGLLETKFIHCKATQLATMKGFYITFIYRANQELQRRGLWKDLKNSTNSIDDAWCILGDFNTVEYTGDRIGGIESFGDCIIACELQELRSIGPYYTWTNKTIYTRIDRAFVNTYWFNPFAFCQVTYMKNTLSDHTALVMDIPWCPKPKTIFQFCYLGVRDPSFLPLIASIKSKLPYTDPLTKLKGFLRDTKSALQKLNKNKFANLRAQLCKARADLEGVQLQFSEEPGNLEWRQKEEMARAHYMHIMSLVIDIIRQQSKAEWISCGDDYTRYFFAKIKRRKTATYIFSIQDDQGQTRQGFLEVKEVMYKYYKNLLGRQCSVRQQLDPNVIGIGNTLTVEQQLKLCAPFTDQEIKSVMFLIPNTKSLGPDGFCSGFFKATWHITGELLRGIIHHFSIIGLMLSFLGETKLVLLPKVLNPTQVKEFRPISCCNVIYKCIAKLLCTRLKEVLPHLIHQYQGAFVKERELLFNIFICQDIAKGYSR